MADGDYLDPFGGIHTQATVPGKAYMYILYIRIHVLHIFFLYGFIPYIQLPKPHEKGPVSPYPSQRICRV